MISEYNAKKFCCEDISKIENYEKAIADTSQTWHCHHRRETVYTRDGLKEIGEYFNRPAIELIFMAPVDHRALHKRGNTIRRGKHHTDEAKEKLRQKMLGNHNRPLKPVIQYDKEGNFISEFASTQEASRKTGVAQSSISLVCNGKQRTAGDSIWRFKEEVNI